MLHASSEARRKARPLVRHCCCVSDVNFRFAYPCRDFRAKPFKRLVGAKSLPSEAHLVLKALYYLSQQIVRCVSVLRTTLVECLSSYLAA